MNLNEIFAKANQLANELMYNEADELYDLLLTKTEAKDKVFYNKSLNLRRAHRKDDALSSIDSALKINPKYLYAYISKFETLGYFGDYEQALRYQEWNYGDSMLSHPDYITSKLKRLDFGDIFVQQSLQNRFGVAEELYQESYEDMLSKVKDKVILVRSSQGLGDVIQCSYYIKELLHYSPKKVIFSVRAELKRLFDFGERVEILDYIPEEYDYFIPIFSLMKILGGMDEPKDGWLNVEGKDSKKVGIVWKGNPQHTNDRFRSSTIKHILEYTDNVDICSLQYAPTEEEQRFMKKNNILDLSPNIKDLYDLGSYMKNMDLVISIDSAPIHLAGALGVNAKCLIPDRREDWRWGFDDSHKHYKSVQLIRF